MKSKEKLTERLKTGGLGYGVRVWGKEACQSISERNNWGYL